MTQRSKIDALLKVADEALTNPDIKIVKNGRVDDGYDSAIAGFGATVVMSGLRPTLAFYCAEKEHEKRKADKRKIIHAIAYTLQSKYGWADHKALFNHCKDAPMKDLENLTIDIVNASVALKIMVRTYKIDKSHE